MDIYFHHGQRADALAPEIRGASCAMSEADENLPFFTNGGQLRDKHRQLDVMAMQLIGGSYRFMRLSLAAVLRQLVLCCSLCHAQANLILNSDFEKLNLIRFPPTFIDGQYYDGLRYDTSFLWGLGWENSRVCSQFVNWQVADTCLKDNTRYSTKKAHSGNVYAYVSNDINNITGVAYFKDLGLSLSEPLIADAAYAFCCFANFENVNVSDLNQTICIKLSDTIVNLDFEHDIKPYIRKATKKPKELSISVNETINCHSFNISARQNGYQNICLRFIAKGGEKYLIIGNLKRVIQGRYKKNLEEERFATPILYKSDIGLVYIDQCSLIRLSNGDTIPVVNKPTVFSEESLEKASISLPSEPQLLASIYFDHGSAAVIDRNDLEEAIDAVQKKKLKNCEIVVIGHTDGTGNAALNTALSQTRARAVAQIILEKIPDANINLESRPGPSDSPLPDSTLRRTDVYLINCKPDK